MPCSATFNSRNVFPDGGTRMPQRQGGPGPQRDLAVSYVPIDSLRPYPDNARRHSPAQIKKIARSLDEFSWTNPLLVGPDGEIICGHGRFEAAKLRGDSKAPVICLEG